MELLSDVELADAADKMPSELSGGMRKRVAIARAMALDPEVVFLDEPGAGLDPITACALDDLILSLRDSKQTTFVVVTHELDSIFRIADRAAMFDKARRGLIALGSPRELKETSTDSFVRRFFNRGRLNG
jgi:phospholipid/cholesterol/gamma-HCH transport system ATP-binding protein